MIVSGVGVLALVALAGVVAVGLSPARPAVTLAFAGLVVGVGAVLTLVVEQVVGITMMIVGLAIGALAVRRDVLEGRAASSARSQASVKD